MQGAQGEGTRGGRKIAGFRRERDSRGIVGEKGGPYSRGGNSPPVPIPGAAGGIQRDRGAGRERSGDGAGCGLQSGVAQ
jgi:hypothetical protein